MNNYGRQLKLVGNTCLQFSEVTTSSDIPTLSIEMGLLTDKWASKIVFQVDPIRELPDLCRYLIGIAGNDLVLKRSMQQSKTLSLKTQKNGVYIGLYHNISAGEDNKFNKVLGKNQLFALRVMALSRLAAVYSVTVTEIIEQLKSG